MNRFHQICLVACALALAVGLIWAAPAVAGDMKGTVMSVQPDDFQFVLSDNQGKKITFKMDEDPEILINNREAQLENLKPGDRAEIVGRQDGDDWLATRVIVERK